MTELHITAGNPDDLARAIVEGKPVSKELAALGTRTLKEHVAELVEKHGVVIEPDTSNVVPLHR